MPSRVRAYLPVMPGVDPTLTARVKALALELGFARAGIARAEALGHEAERLREWLAAGHHGSMGYMAETAGVRADPRDARMLQSACSVIVLAAPYARAGHAADGPVPGRVARYAQGRDYHNALHARLRKLTRMLREAGHATRAAVDSMPVLERAWAQRAGIGFIGKNSCLIVPGLGSHVFLAAIVTSAQLEADSRCASVAANAGYVWMPVRRARSWRRAGWTRGAASRT